MRFKQIPPQLLQLLGGSRCYQSWPERLQRLLKKKIPPPTPHIPPLAFLNFPRTYELKCA